MMSDWDLESPLGEIEEMPEVNLTVHTIFFKGKKLIVLMEDSKKLVKVTSGELDAVIGYLRESWDLSFLLAADLASKWMLESINKQRIAASCDGSSET